MLPRVPLPLALVGLAAPILFLALFPLLAPTDELEAHATVGPPPDLRFGGGADATYAFLDGLDDEGRSIYARFERVDLLAPLVFGPGLFLALSHLVRRWSPEGSRWRLLAYAPLVGALLDVVENLALLSMLDAYPERRIGLATLQAWATTLKLPLGFGSLLGALAGYATLGGRALVHRARVARQR